MNYKIFTLLFAATLITSVANAKIFRIGYTTLYNATPNTGVDYDNFSDAQDQASNGDTMQIYGEINGPGGYVIVNKSLVILGFGYYFDIHPDLQVIGGQFPSTIPSLIFYGSSSGTIIKGVSGNYWYIEGEPSGTPISDITIEGCNIQGALNFYNSLSGSYSGSISNIKLNRCVINSLLFYQDPPNSKPVTNLQINNCTLGNYIHISDPGTTVYITNCIWNSGVYNLYFETKDAQVLVKNSIFKKSGYSSTTNINTIYENNFFQEGQPAILPPGSNNRWGQDFSTIFTVNSTTGNSSYPDENNFILKPGSPAILGGFDENNKPTDCGIFGGEPAYRYVISGMPPVPSIYKLEAPGQAASSNPYNITISVRSNN